MPSSSTPPPHAPKTLDLSIPSARETQGCPSVSPPKPAKLLHKAPEIPTRTSSKGSTKTLLSEAGLVPAKMLLDFRQKAYAYRLLALPDHYPTKHILPISLREGDENSQPGEQPDYVGRKRRPQIIWSLVSPTSS